jgi:predicted ribosomally synthesized peptide with SipW-like signal peptide
MLTVLIIAAVIGGAVLLSTSGTMASWNDEFDTAKPIESWGSMVTKALPESGAGEHPTTSGTSNASGTGAPTGIPESASDDAWIQFYKNHGYHVPPEYPTNPADYGIGGDLDSMPRELRDRVAAALFMDDDPNSLLALSDDALLTPYPLAAQRLVKKAMRLIV